MKHLFAFLTASLLILSSCSDDCSDTVCLNSGVCDEGVCECTFEYTGDDCSDEQRATLYGTYAGTSMTSFGPLPDTITITQNGTTITSMYLDDSALAQYMLGDNIEATLTVASAFDVPLQSQGPVTYEGNGSLTGDALSIDMTVVTPTVTIDVTFTGTKL